MVQGNIASTHRYSVDFLHAESIKDLRTDWRLLERQIRPGMFLSWHWLNSWLETLSEDPLTVKVRRRNQLVALGLFGTHTERRHGLLKSKIAYLHQTGRPAEDQIWIEYNGLLASPEHRIPATQAVVTALLASGYCDEVHLSMLPAECALPEHRHGRTLEEVSGFIRNLAALREQNTSVLEGLSSNTRYQVRRSLKRYTELYGTPSVCAAGTRAEATAMFREADTLHQQRWTDSGFKNPTFVAFHETLLKRGFDHGNVQLFRVAFGNHVIGIFHYLCDNGRACFYLQGVRSESDGKLKPGLTGHSLLMQHFLETGYDSYDFMGGDSQYKRQLADRQQNFVIQRRHNGHWRFCTEDMFRSLKQRWQQIAR